MAYDSSLADRVAGTLTSRRVVFTTKAMFGGLCFMVDDKMCLGILDNRLMVRLDPELESQAMQRPGAGPMTFTGRTMKGYVFVEAEGHDSDLDLRQWIDWALAFNPKAQASKKRAGKRPQA